MSERTQLSCACGRVRLEVERAPIVSAECHCTSCRTAGAQLQARPDARPVLEANGGTHFVLYRKDRIHFLQGTELLKEHRLSPHAKTRRVLASCCNSPVFLEFERGHWLSMYAGLWPEDVRPAIELRTMISDLADASSLPDDVPNARYQSFMFFKRLLAAWAAMGFRAPKSEVGRTALS
jgi:hypothetical protein